MSDLEPSNADSEEVEEPEDVEESVELEKAVKKNDLSKKSAEEINEKLKKLEQAIGMGRLMQGELLVHMYTEKRYMELGYKVFDSYCESELEMSRRTAFYRMSVYNKLITGLHIPTNRIERIGWSKAALVASAADEHSVEYWLTNAEANSYRAVKMEIHSMKTPPQRNTLDGEAINPCHKLTFMLTDDQLENIEAALENAAGVCKARSRNVFLDYICLQYNSDAVFSTDSGSKAAQLEWYISRLESTFNVKLEVKDENTEDSTPTDPGL